MLYEGIAKFETAVIATTMVIAGETSPADTAASPIIKAPAIETVGPMARGIRIPASRRISKVNSNNSASIIAG
ncbi:hypothetical protein D3C84_1204520 [compost metagenome]